MSLQYPNSALQIFNPKRLICLGIFLGSFVVPFALAEDGIVAQRENGRMVFVNDESSARTVAASPTATAQKRRLVYWSQLERRWKPVPPPSRNALRNARYAVNEINALVARTPLLPSSGAPELTTTNQAPDTKALTSGHRITQAEVDAAIEAAAAKHHVDPNLVRSLIRVESNFNPRAVSNKGAMGLMQLMPGTARDLKVRNPFDVNQNVDGGVRHLKGLLDNFGGDITLSLAAYNAGAGAVARNGGVPPYRETRDYVKKITKLYGTDHNGTTAVVRGSNIKANRDAGGRVIFTNE
ncbi:MAG TPA: lytic transglycosylase domain-containing protein [Terriglobales bacterium]|nr:lytic transglycosylase domain-containing protein [Terriglobales bacterium]